MIVNIEEVTGTIFEILVENMQLVMQRTKGRLLFLAQNVLRVRTGSFRLPVKRASTDSKHRLDRSRPAIDLSLFAPDKIRNFCIIAHVDHGKSTLADRLLEMTGTISHDVKNEQVLDRLQVERERGITVKAQSATLIHQRHGESYLLNLIDTPGHVDFSFEVSRSLRACQGVILLIDANQGVQAQTVANFFLAFELDLIVIPVLNKVDLKLAKPDEVAKQAVQLFDANPDEILQISAKFGTGVMDVLDAVVDRIPPPVCSSSDACRALLFDSWYANYRGVGCSVAMTAGTLRKGDKITLVHSQRSYEVTELGVMHPDEMATDVLYAGQVGYMYANMRNTKEATVGDTICHESQPVEALPGFRAAKPMVFAGIFPADQSQCSSLKTAIEKLLLNDSSVSIEIDSSAALGQGWRLGFLGMLHMDVFCERLEQEYLTPVIMTTPNVPYRVRIRGEKHIKLYGAEELTILNPCNMPDPSIISEYSEPFVNGTIMAPDSCAGNIMSIIRDRRGECREQTTLENGFSVYKVVFPLSEIIVDFYDELKSITSGYGSFDYEDAGYRSSSLVRLDIYLNGQPVEEMTHITHMSQARPLARQIALKLKENLDPHLFQIAIQVKVGAKVVAREDMKALRKDVTAKLYGGDLTRRTKLLKRQAEGKKVMRKIGKINVPKEVFVSILKR